MGCNAGEGSRNTELIESWCCALHEVLIITTCVFAGGWVLLVIIRARLSCGSRSHQGHGRDQGKDPFSPTHPTLRLISLGVWHAPSDLPVIAARAPTGYDG